MTLVDKVAVDDFRLLLRPLLSPFQDNSLGDQ